jgi:hypothetical protein
MDKVKERFSKLTYKTTFQILDTNKSKWLFVCSYPYRSRDIFDIYVFESPEDDNDGEYKLRSMIVVYRSRDMVAECKSENGGIGVYHEKQRIAWLTPRDAMTNVGKQNANQ